ncbi:hypothetical protein BKA67DRAFT_110660 [Truncatella angustata]|uniref:Uncharacterized protein n=1 Tax=Truncatella angustata TaxID=152316 RepID=A0A9P8RJ86_9PEZI|nr:uncharacterized protein BKA67DRAFT_110660 [Truncatella angustata]KAH6645328.1 hypothetical protein BKA67DRAFT_110660 [Truncatella angustata]
MCILAHSTRIFIYVKLLIGWIYWGSLFIIPLFPGSRPAQAGVLMIPMYTPYISVLPIQKEDGVNPKSGRHQVYGRDLGRVSERLASRGHLVPRYTRR